MKDLKEFEAKIAQLMPEDKEIMDTLVELQAERERQGISQKDFAARIGMAPAQLSKIETLDSFPTLRTLNRYARGLGLALELKVVKHRDEEKVRIL